MSKRSPALTALLALLLAVTAAACSNTRFGGGNNKAEKTIGLSISTLNNPFFVDLRDGAQAAATKQGAKLVVTDAQNDATKQANDVQSFITQKVAAILINPVDSDAIVPSVQAANDAKIPILALDRGSSGGEVAATIASDNVAGGSIAADFLAKAVGNGPVFELQGIPGTSAARDRGKGFDTQIATKPGIKVVAKQPAGFDRGQGLNVTQNLLQAHPDVKGIFAQNDEMALGAIQALGNKAGKVIVVGFDGTPDGLKAVQAGTMAALVAQQPRLIGGTGVEDALKVIAGDKVETQPKVEVKLVTKDNVADFLKA
jgi:ribose transport system substrate-binding protein